MLINEYEIATDRIPGRLFHVDLYRLHDEADLESIGYAEIIAPIDSVTLVEWPERAQHLLPRDYLLIEFTFGDSDQRRMEFSFRSSTAGATDRLAQSQSVAPGLSLNKIYVDSVLVASIGLPHSRTSIDVQNTFHPDYTATLVSS